MLLKRHTGFAGRTAVMCTSTGCGHACRLPEAALQRMAAEMLPLTVFPGQDLSHQGEAADRIFVLAEGAPPAGEINAL